MVRMTSVDPEFVQIWRRVLKLRRRGRHDLAEQLNDVLKAMIILSVEDESEAEHIATEIVKSVNHDTR